MKGIHYLAIAALSTALASAPALAQKPPVGRAGGATDVYGNPAVEASDFTKHRMEMTKGMKWSADNDWQRTRRASMLLGTLVVDEKGNRIGNIEDVMFDNDGKVSHVLVSGDVVLKVADRHVVLPWDTLEVPILVATALAALPMLEGTVGELPRETPVAQTGTEVPEKGAPAPRENGRCSKASPASRRHARCIAMGPSSDSTRSTPWPSTSTSTSS